jgi:hypothetical protein
MRRGKTLEKSVRQDILSVWHLLYANELNPKINISLKKYILRTIQMGQIR